MSFGLGYRGRGSVLTQRYRLVIDSISPLEPERKCFRMVGGVLVERTIKEVLPALETNYSGVSRIIRGMDNVILTDEHRSNKSLSSYYRHTNAKKKNSLNSKRSLIFKLYPSNSNNKGAHCVY